MKEISSKEFYILTGVLQNNSMWRVELRDLKEGLKQEKSIYVVDPYQNYVSSSFGYFELDAYLELADENTIVYLPYVQEEELVLPVIISQLLFKINCHWINLSFEYFLNDSFNNMLKDILKIKDINPTYPSSVNFLNFLSSNPYKICGVVFSGYSYNNKYNSGYALSTFDNFKPPTLKAIENTLKKEKSIFWNLSPDMLHIVTNGGLLVNYHIVNDYINKEFIEEICDKLNRLDVKCVLLLGSNIFLLENLFNKKIKILKEKHPLEVLRLNENYETNMFKEFEKYTGLNF